MKIKSVYPRPKRFRGAGLLFAFIFAVAFIKLIGLAQRCGFGSSRYQSIFPSSFSLTTTPYQPNRQHDHLSKHASEWTGYSIKPIAYVFPQFHAIPENDRFWGANFTEWVNVKKVKENAYGLETLQPAKEIGYYNLLDYNVRERYAKLVKDSGCVESLFPRPSPPPRQMSLTAQLRKRRTRQSLRMAYTYHSREPTDSTA